MIINVTNIGKEINGLGRYSLYLSKYILAQELPYEIYVNENALIHFNDKEKKSLRVVSKFLSPDYGFKGHLNRLIWTNQYRKKTIFNASQLEVSFFNKQQIVTVHDVIPLHFPKEHGRQYLFFKHLLPRVLKNVNKIITVSEHTKSQLIDYYQLDESKITVIHNGIDISKGNIKRAKKDYILYVGRDSEMKNIKRLIKAFCMAQKKYGISQELYLVGIEKQEEYAMCKNIKFLGYVSSERLEILYQEAKVFFFPTLYEGFGYPVLEAMKASIPVITSNISSLPEITGNAALLINPYNIAEMAESLFSMIKDKNMQKRYVDNGLRQIEYFSLKTSLEKHINLFESLS